MDVSFLEQVFAVPGPYATVCADVTHTTETADTELDLRARALAERLTEQGAPEAVVETVRGRLLEANEGGAIGTLRGRALAVSAGGAVVLDEPLVDSPRPEIADWSSHPDLLPVLRQLPGRVPHIVVITDRVGAEVIVSELPGRPEEETEVEGDTFHIRKVKAGRWAQDHWQHHAENHWAVNAERVAESISSYAREIAPRFVLVAGDVRARQLLVDHADEFWKDLVVQIDEGGRAPGADREPIERREAELVAEHEAREHAKVLEQIRAAAAHRLSVTGLEPVIEVLRKDQVETLVLADPPDVATLLVGESPILLGVTKEELEALGAQQVQVVPADRALIAAAVAFDSAIVVLPREAMPGGVPVAAVLRYTDAATPVTPVP